jgi:hypothetical protein
MNPGNSGNKRPPFPKHGESLNQAKPATTIKPAKQFDADKHAAARTKQTRSLPVRVLLWAGIAFGVLIVIGVIGNALSPSKTTPPSKSTTAAASATTASSSTTSQTPSTTTEDPSGQRLTDADIPDVLMPGVWPGAGLKVYRDGDSVTAFTNWSQGETTVDNRTTTDAAQSVCAGVLNDLAFPTGITLAVKVYAADGQTLLAHTDNNDKCDQGSADPTVQGYLDQNYSGAPWLADIIYITISGWDGRAHVRTDFPDGDIADATSIAEAVMKSGQVPGVVIEAVNGDTLLKV